MLKNLLRTLFDKTDDLFETAFHPDSNPFRHLGAMGWFFYWIVIVSGIYLYIFFDTGVTQAYSSVEYLTHEQWYIGGVMRSFHRYASDALVVVILLHLLREFAWDRLHGPRNFAWITGIALLWFLYASGITGYWIVWDKLAQYIAITTTEWLDTLPFFGEPIARNFISDASLSGRFFTLMIFIHIFVPLLMLFLMWIHIQRLSLPDVNPSRNMLIGVLAGLLILSFALPAQSQGPVVLAEVPAKLGLDWFYLFMYPLLDHLPGLILWLLLIVFTIVLVFLPWLPSVPNDIAVVDLDNCNGCGRCVLDCPYGAIVMRDRTDELPYQLQAEVNAGLCTGCGICNGSCPTATPFRKRTKLSSGIQLGNFPVIDLKEQILDRAGSSFRNDHILLFGCEQGPNINQINMENVATIQLPCIGMLPPSFIDFAISRNLFGGICLSGCKECDCYHRFGNTWSMNRINRKRDPYLRERIDRNRIKTCWVGKSGTEKLQAELKGFTETLSKSEKGPECFN